MNIDQTARLQGANTDMSRLQLTLLLNQLVNDVKLKPKDFNAEQKQAINLLTDIFSPSQSRSPRPNALFYEPKEIQSDGLTALEPSPSIPSSPSNSVQLSPSISPSLPNPSVFVTAYESYRMRRIISNIRVILFLYHPTGVLQDELSMLYQQMYDESFVMFDALKYLLSVDKGIVTTHTAQRGALFTLNSNEIEFIVSQFDAETLCAAVVHHIQKIFRCYPNGIDCHFFEQVFYNMVQVQLSSIVPMWFKFVQNIPCIYCVNINGRNVFIQIDGANALNVKKQCILQQYDRVGGYDPVRSRTSKQIEGYLMHHLNVNNVLKHCYGYDELLMALFHEHNINIIGISGPQMEQLFYKLYQSRLVYESPYVQSKLQGICEITYTSSGETLYRLSKTYIAYMKENMDGFNAIFNRELRFNASVRPRKRNVDTIPKSPFSEDHCTVFMGGFCKGDSATELARELTEMGVTVVSCPGIQYRSYGWALVTLKNSEECDYLLSISPIHIMRRSVDVRPYLDRYKACRHPYVRGKPSQRQMMVAIQQFIHDSKSDSLSIAELQSRLFRKFAYRISGPEINKLVSNHPNVLFMRRSAGQTNSPQIYVRKPR